MTGGALDLFWFRSPKLQQWIYNVSALGIIISLMFMTYGLWNGGTQFIRNQGTVSPAVGWYHRQHLRYSLCGPEWLCKGGFE